MSMPHESEHAALALRLVLGDEVDPAALGAIDANVLARLAARHGVLLRVADRLGWAGDGDAPAAVAALVADERERVRTVLERIDDIAQVCSARGIAFLFPKAFHHYPDMGSDVDLLVFAPSADVDEAIVTALGASPIHIGLRARIAGTTGYRIAGCRAPLDIHHGRLGQLGEHVDYATALLGRCRMVEVGGLGALVPSADDQLVLQALHGVYGRLTIRVSDVAHVVSLVRHGSLDWTYVIATARRLGILAGLGCYLAYAEQIHASVFGGQLLPPPARAGLRLAGWGRVEFRRGYYRFPVPSVSGRAYLAMLRAHVTSRNWGAVARLCLLPVVATAAATQRLPRPRSSVRLQHTT